jgi:uroporphyrinogen-III synthase
MVERRLAYASVAATSVPEALLGRLDIVLFHSARAADAFVALGAPNAALLTAACFSPAVAEAARGAPWRRLIVSPAPREEALLDAVLGSRHSPAGASA